MSPSAISSPAVRIQRDFRSVSLVGESSSSVLSEAFARAARNAYNMASFATRKMKLLSIVFVTSMTYFHEVAQQIGVDGVQAVNEVTMICACILLAAKVEHVRLQLSKLIAVVFDVEEKSEDARAYRKMVLEVEMLICSRLGFDFQRISPMARLNEIAPRSLTDPALDELSRASNKLLSYLLLSPIIAEVPANEIADCLVHIAARSLVASGHTQLELLQQKLPCPTSEVTDRVESALLRAMLRGGKVSHLDLLDKKLHELKEREGRLKRERSV